MSKQSADDDIEELFLPVVKLLNVVALRLCYEHNTTLSASLISTILINTFPQCNKGYKIRALIIKLLTFTNTSDLVVIPISTKELFIPLGK